jgi:hypothetical protein
MLSWDDPIPATPVRPAHIPSPMPALQLVSSAAVPTVRRVRVEDAPVIDGGADRESLAVDGGGLHRIRIEA